MWQGLGEAALNIVFSVGLTWMLVRRGWGSSAVIGVAAGSVLPTVLFGWGVLWRWAAAEVGVRALALFRGTILRPLLACVPMLLTGLLFRAAAGPEFGDPRWLPCLIGMAVTGAAGAAGVWTIALTREEKDRLRRSAASAPRSRPASPCRWTMKRVCKSLKARPPRGWDAWTAKAALAVGSGAAA